MTHSNKKLKTFISFFTLIIILLSIALPKINDDEYYAATVKSSTNTQETTKKKSHGHKVEGAEYHEELWDKFSVIAADNGGGSGEGGGAGDSDAKNAGNSGEYDEAGGTFGGAAGVGLGSGATQNLSGEGAGNRGGSTGSVTADALRQLKMNIEESRAESMAKVLETALNAESVAASIAEREREQESIQRKMQQESVRARLAARRSDSFGAYDNKIPPSRNYTTVRETVEISEPRANVIVSEETLSPVNRNITIYDGNNLVPTEMNTESYDNYISIPRPETVATFYDNNVLDIPTTMRETEVQYEEISTLATLETFDTPLVYEETSTIIEEEVVTTEAQTLEMTTAQETEKANDETEGMGSKGGENPEADEDLKGDDGENESQGKAEEKGQYQLETKGEFAGKKIFELKQNGNFGFEPEHLSVAGLKNLMTSTLTLLVLIGALLFIISTKDKKGKGSYF